MGVAFVTGATMPTNTDKPPVEVKADAAKPVVVVGQKTGYFNMAKVMRESKRAKTGVARLNSRKDRLVANLIGVRKMFLDLKAAAEKPNPARPKEEIEDEMRMLTRRMEDMDREIKKLLSQRATIIIVELYDEMRAITTAVARDNGLVAILAYPDATNMEEAENPMVKELKLKPPALQPFYLDPSVDFTDEIVRRLNEKFDAENGD
jgi:Skp family chaperone for outer membrane proteins